MDILRIYQELDKEFNYKIVDKQPLAFIPEAKMQIYSIDNGLGLHLFDTKEQMNKYLEDNNSSYIRKLTLGYIGKLADKNNVIEQVYEDNNEPKLISIVDKNSYLVYNFIESKKRGKYIWNRYMGDLSGIYSEFEKKSYIESKIKFK